jgi:hypothetical protein
MTTNKRYIDIDADTRVGYNYIKQQFYVTNKEYTTYRSTLPLIRKVLDSLNVPNDNPTDAEIQALEDYTENLYKVSFTWQDTGAYIHTLQFNDFDQYPLTIDCEKKKLYIMNSTIIYDLTLNESPRNVRIPRILSFYKDTLGLLITPEDMRYFYSLLLSYYFPTCYNQIILEEDTEKYFYNNKFLLSNYNNTSNATYTCTYNPNNTAQNTKVAYIIGTDTTSNTLIANPAISTEDLQGYTQVILEGTNTIIDESVYSADGTYTVESIEGNLIKVKETLPFAYSFPYKECYVLSAQATVTSMNAQNNQITLTNLPENVLVGDVILISGATVTTTYETISCNGTYTIESIQDNVITVEEEIPTDFEGEATLIKEVFISNISKIRAKKLTFTDSTDLDLTGAIIMVHTTTGTGTTIENYTVESYTSTSVTVAGDISAYDYTKACPQLYIPVPTLDEDAEVLIEITSVSKNAETLMPLGEFMVDSFEQCQDYLGTLSKLVIPTEKTKNNMYKELPTIYPLEEILDITTNYEGDKISCSIESMTCKGIYSKVYSEKEE